jgi:hypothetical protein
MSFGFRVRGERGEDWRMVNGEPLRELIDVDLVDVSIVTFPAYEATEVSMRSLTCGGELRAARPVEYSGAAPVAADAVLLRGLRVLAAKGEQVEMRHRLAKAMGDLVRPFTADEVALLAVWKQHESRVLRAGRRA